MPGHLLNTRVVYGHRVAPGSRMNKQEYLSLMGVHNGPAPLCAPVTRRFTRPRTAEPRGSVRGRTKRDRPIQGQVSPACSSGTIGTCSCAAGRAAPPGGVQDNNDRAGELARERAAAVPAQVHCSDH